MSISSIHNGKLAVSKLKTQDKKLEDYEIGDKLAFTKLSNNYGKITEVIGFHRGKLVIGNCGPMRAIDGSLELKVVVEPNSPLIERV